MIEAHVIGAGLSGLSTAWSLAQQGARVHVFEAGPEPGGLIRTFRTAEGLVETAAPAFTSTERVLALFASTGVEGCVPNRALAKRYIFRDGRPRRWPLSPVETCAFFVRGGSAWITRRHRPRDDESLGEWGRRVMGRAPLTWLVAPTAQIYAASPDELSAEAVLGGRRRSTRLSPRNGMQELIDGLAARLTQRGVRFSFDEPVASLDAGVPTAVCTNAPTAARLLQSVAPAVSSALEKIRTVSLVTATAFFEASDNDLRGFGVLFPRGCGVTALGVLFNSDMFPHRSHLRSETWIYGDATGSAFATGAIREQDLRSLLETDRALLTGRTDRAIAVYVTPRPGALPLYDQTVLHAAAAAERLPSTVALAGNYLGSIGVSQLVDRGADAAARLLRSAATAR